MSKDGILKSGDSPNCPVCVQAGDPLSTTPRVPGTGLIKQMYEEEVFHGPLPEKLLPTPMGPMPFRPGLQQMVALINPVKPPLLAAIKIKMLFINQEICEKCGAIWINHWELREVMGQADVRPPGMPPGGRQMNPGR